MAASLVISGNAVTPDLTIGPDYILSIRSNLSSSVDGSEVAVDTCESEVQDTRGVNVGLFIPSDYDSLTTSDGKLFYVETDHRNLPEIPYGTEVRHYEGTDLMGLWYLSEVTRIGRDKYQLDLISGLGLLDNVPHAGGIYNGVTVNSLLSEIISGTFSYTVDSAIRSWKVWGWLPYATARDNLHQLLMAMGLNIFKNSNGSPRFGLLSSANPITVSDTEIYMEGKVGYGAPATSVAVTEHQWARVDTEPEVLYSNLDGSPAAENTIVTFDEPCFDLQTTGTLTINASGVNYAEVTGVGELTGKKYTHMQRIVRKETNARNVKPRELTVTDAYLVNSMNSLNVAARVLSYYSSGRTLSGKMIWGSARPGSAVRMKNVFGELESAIISKMDLISSATLAASFEAVANYNPGSGGNNYTRRVEITENGTWTKPAGVTSIRQVLIAGGQGGQSGGNGGEGQNGAQGGAGAGGVGGQPGHGGSVYVADITVPSAALTFHVSVGTGGVGGIAPHFGQPGDAQYYGVPDAEPVDGAEGTDTSFYYDYNGRRTTFTSATGSPLDNGYGDVITGAVYAMIGTLAGVAGGSGGSGGGKGQDVSYSGGQWKGGKGGAGAGGASGGSGGGAAVGNNGENGLDARYYQAYYYGGDGGRGGDGSSQQTQGNYGQGGNGGHGSGGGGAGGRAGSVLLTGAGGKPGVAGPGSKGVDGIAIFYY